MVFIKNFNENIKGEIEKEFLEEILKTSVLHLRNNQGEIALSIAIEYKYKKLAERISSCDSLYLHTYNIEGLELKNEEEYYKKELGNHITNKKKGIKYNLIKA